MPLTPQQVADKWAARAAAAGAAYKDGIQNVTVAPGQLAVQNQSALLANFNEAVNSGRWARRTQAVSLGQWQQAAMGKGAANYGTGIQAGKSKYAAAIQYFLPIAQAASQAARAVPRDGGAGSLQRVAIVMEAMKQAKANRGA